MTEVESIKTIEYFLLSSIMEKEMELLLRLSVIIC